jgi:hypothetical protein
LYVELPLMGVMAAGYWLFIGRRLKSHAVPARTDVEGHTDEKGDEKDGHGSHVSAVTSDAGSKWLRSDVVNKRTVDLHADEHNRSEEDEEGPDGEDTRARRKSGKWGWAWRVYYVIA